MSATRSLVIADDHPLFRKGLVEVLREDGSWQIDADVGDGDAAVQAIQRHRPAIAVLDIDMPKRSGIEVAIAMREQGIPTTVVLLTMHKSREMLEGALRAGVRGYVLKEHASTTILACLNLVGEGGTYVSPGIGAVSEAAIHATANDSAAARAIAILSPTEREVARLIAANKTTKEIAVALAIKPKTVEHHRTNICAKLEIHGMNALVRFAAEHKTLLQ